MVICFFFFFGWCSKFTGFVSIVLIQYIKMRFVVVVDDIAAASAMFHGIGRGERNLLHSIDL